MKSFFVLLSLCFLSLPVLAETIGSPRVCTAPAVYTLEAKVYTTYTESVLGISSNGAVSGCVNDILYTSNTKRIENALSAVWNGSGYSCLGNYSNQSETCVAPACPAITEPYYWEGNYCRGRSYDSLPACTITEGFVDSSFCSSLTPPACSNGIKDSFESGIDCGGFCSSIECILICPPDLQRFTTADGHQSCRKTCEPTTSNGYSRCPEEWTLFNVSGAIFCFQDSSVIDATIAASQEYEDANPHDPPATYSQAAPPTAPTTTTTTTAPPVTTSTPGGAGAPAGAPAGTESVKQETTTTQNPDGSTTTIITNHYYPNADGTGNELGSDEETTTSGGDPAYDPAGYIPTGLTVGDLDTTIETPEKTDLGSFLLSFLAGHPLISMMQSFTVTTSASQCSIVVHDVYGQNLDFDLCRHETLFRALGAFLLVVIQGYAVLVVVRGWK